MRQNRAGKFDSQHVPKSDYVTEYRDNDILIANIGPYLKKIWFATNNGGVLPMLSTMRVNSKDYLPQFIYYSLFQNRFFDFAIKSSKGSSIPTTPHRQKTNYGIPDYRFRYANTEIHSSNPISVFDNKIALNQKINTKLENLARDLYNHWFVQFDFPDKFGQPYKTDRIKPVEER